MEATVILGAGFSKNSGIPVQAEIPELILSHPLKDVFENAVTFALKNFMQHVYGFNGKDNFPNLDDMFTCIDISTNSGHHLGMKYSPLHLRAVRRLLVYRVFSILNEYFKPDIDVKNLVNMLLNSFSSVSFVVLNWDTVLEKYLLSSSQSININYCNGGKPLQPDCGGRQVNMLKLHGSSNWLYCDNCRNLFYDMDGKVSLRKRAGFEIIDFEILDELKGLDTSLKEEVLKHEKCILCGNRVSSHIATFSYRKSFRANSFANIWNKAEQVLASSQKWIFIGYSLPDADYEFKHLMKISQLKYSHMDRNKLSVDVILQNSTTTIEKYKKFFGNNLGESI